MSFWNFLSSFGRQPLFVEKNLQGDWMYTMYSSRGNQHQILQPEAKLRAVLKSPAAMLIFTLQCDLFSLGRITNDKGEVILPTLRRTPNYKSGWTQWEWDYMFWNMMGTAYQYVSGGKLLDDNNTVQWLNPSKILWEPTSIQKMMDFIFTKATYKDIVGENIRYVIGNGKTKYIPLKDIIPIHDLSSNMNDNWYVGISRVDSLYKIISNSEEALDSKASNLDMSKKWLVAGKQDPNNVTELPMGEDEKRSIEDSINGGKRVHANKSMIDIKRFVENIAQLKLDDSFWADVYTIGKMYNIPRDIIEAYVSQGGKGSTYDNQEKALITHIEHSLKPKGDELCECLKNTFVNVPGDIKMTWDHLSCYNTFETERQNVVSLKLNNAILAKENGLKLGDYEN